MVSTHKITFRVGQKTILHETSLDFPYGLFHVIMGANGAGKSTLLKILSGDEKSSTGKVYLQDKEMNDYTKKELAVKRAVLSQHYHLAFPIAVTDVVLMGRYPYYAAAPSANDIAICNKAMALMEVEKFGERDYTTLSGGEAQKVQMSRVLSQIWSEEQKGGKVLFLDEPVSHLDVKYQYQLMRIAKEFCKTGTTVIAILHDLNLAINFADKMLLMKDGKIIHQLSDAGQLTPAIIEETFGVKPAIIYSGDHPKPVVVF